MKTPPELIGRENPKTGKPFGREIKLGLGTRHLPEAQKKRDIILGEIRSRVAIANGAEDFSLESAAIMRREIVKDEEKPPHPADMTGDPSAPVDETVGYAVGLRGIVVDKIESAGNRPRSKRPSKKKLETYAKVALGDGYALSDALELYLENRAENNAAGYKPLSQSTVKDVRTAVRYLSEFMDGYVELEDVTPDVAQDFRFNYLPNLTSAHAKDGLSSGTINKHITMLSGVWKWARERRLIKGVNPWSFESGVPKAKRSPDDRRAAFSPEQVQKICAAFPQGDRLGDAFRLALVTGCRSDEVAKLLVSDVDEDVAGFVIRVGKTENARRYIPLIGVARQLMRQRLTSRVEDGRVFPDWPIRPSTGKVSALPQAFTRERRRVLGRATDKRLSFHSTRHTWRTVARNTPGIIESIVLQLGGWAKEGGASSIYDHGAVRERLTETQEAIGAEMERQGYLERF